VDSEALRFAAAVLKRVEICRSRGDETLIFSRRRTSQSESRYLDFYDSNRTCAERIARAKQSPLKVLIIPDKFKGTLTAREAGQAIAEGWRAIRPDDQLEILPMSDGGDGFGEIIGGMIGAEPVEVDTIDAAHRPHKAKFWFDSKNRVAVIEAAQVNGLALLPPGKFHPFDLDTFGLGKVYQSAIEEQAAKIIFGIGGSSTNDGGFGFARALGYQFLDQKDVPIQKWADLERLERIVMSAHLLPIETIVAVDVQNPLLGPNGASRIYGPQKGLREGDMAKAEACLARLASVWRSLNERAAARTSNWSPAIAQDFYDYASVPGTGAAGGLGFGLLAFTGAKFRSGAEVFAEAARLDERLKSADLVISGEGAIDSQSLMGKGVGELFQRCQKAGVKFIGLAGMLTDDVAQEFAANRSLTLMGIVPVLASAQQSKAEPAKYLRLLASEAARSVASV
jgi:glycerate kinase